MTRLSPLMASHKHQGVLTLIRIQVSPSLVLLKHYCLNGLKLMITHLGLMIVGLVCLHVRSSHEILAHLPMTDDLGSGDGCGHGCERLLDRCILLLLLLLLLLTRSLPIYHSIVYSLHFRLIQKISNSRLFQ